MTSIAVAITAVVVPAFAMVADRLSGVVAGQTFTVTVTGRATGVTRTAIAIAAAHSTAMAATIAAAVSTAIATATATATAIFRVGGAHDRQAIRQQRGSCQHQGARQDCNETLVF